MAGQEVYMVIFQENQLYSESARDLLTEAW